MAQKRFYVGIKGVVIDPDRGVLLLRKDFKSGEKWGVPGGRVDGVESFEVTLRRELAEELPGIVIHSIGDVLGARRLTIDIADDTSLALIYYAVRASLPKEVILSDEHFDYCFISSIEDAPEGLNAEEQQFIAYFLKNNKL